MNRLTCIALLAGCFLAVSGVIYAQVDRQPAPAAQTGLYQFVAKSHEPQLQGVGESLYRCNTVTGEIEVLMIGHGKPRYRWERIYVGDQ